VDISKLGRAEMAALIVETLAAHDIDVVLVGGSCVCVWTNEKFGSLDLDFIDLTYSRRKQIAVALSQLGFSPNERQPKYFTHPDCQWSVEFPTAPLAVGHEYIGDKQVATKETSTGTLRLLSPTDTIKDRLLWWYLENDPQCWEQALEIARNHKVRWADLKKWHEGEGYADQLEIFRRALEEHRS
tara:strand:+ start:2782 stop:3336 length:555 start_codon:yes stop_codon:yes gene_type:complete